MHGWQIAEVAPAAPAIAGLLPPLAMLCILIVCFGIVHGIDAVVRGFFGTVSGAIGWIPYLGNLVEEPIHKIEQKIVSFLSGLEQDIDSAIGHFWHALAATVEHLWHTLVGDSLIVWNALRFLTGVLTLHELLHAERWLRRLIHTVEATAAHALRHGVHFLDHYIRSVAQGVYPRLRTLEHEVEKTIPREIKHARSLAREAEDAAARLWRHVKTLPSVADVEAIVAAAIAALGLLAFDFLKCPSWRGLGNKLTCGMGQLLLDLLEGAIAIMVVEDICAITHLAVSTAESGPVQAFLTDTIGSMDGLLTCQGVKVAAPLSGPYFEPPPVQPYAALA